MPLTVYGNKDSPNCRAVLMLADHLECKVDWKEIDLQKGEHMTPEFLKRNPLHSVPVLEHHGTVIAANTHAILQYIASKYGSDSLYPKDVAKRAAVDDKLFFDATYACSAFRSYVKDVRKNKQPVQERHIKNIIEVYEFMQAFLSKNKFIAGSHLTIADFSLVSTITSLEVVVPINLEKYRDVRRWLNECHELEIIDKMNRAGVARVRTYMGQMFAYFYV